MLCHVTFTLMFSVFMFVSRCFLLIINIPVKCEKVNGILIRSLEGFRRSVSQWLLITLGEATSHIIKSIISFNKYYFICLILKPKQTLLANLQHPFSGGEEFGFLLNHCETIVHLVEIWKLSRDNSW